MIFEGSILMFDAMAGSSLFVLRRVSFHHVSNTKVSMWFVLQIRMGMNPSALLTMGSSNGDHDHLGACHVCILSLKENSARKR